jgi:hypothetical protein
VSRLLGIIAKALQFLLEAWYEIDEDLSVANLLGGADQQSA